MKFMSDPLWNNENMLYGWSQNTHICSVCQMNQHQTNVGTADHRLNGDGVQG